VHKQLRITLVKSYIGQAGSTAKVLTGMGLGKLNKTVLLNDTPEIRGMVRKVNHLVFMEELKGKGKDL